MKTGKTRSQEGIANDDIFTLRPYMDNSVAIVPPISEHVVPVISVI